jgi:hypothetical protein
MKGKELYFFSENDGHYSLLGSIRLKKLKNLILVIDNIVVNKLFRRGKLFTFRWGLIRNTK